MKLHQIPRNPVLSTMKREICSRAAALNNSQGISGLKQCDGTFMSELLDRRWALVRPDTQIHKVTLSGIQPQCGEGPSGVFCFANDTRPSLGDAKKERQDQSFYVVRDDLLHPLVNGNKARKLDGLLPLVEDHLATDVLFLALRED